VALATVHAALDATGSDLGNARVVIVGAGSAGSGIAGMLVDAGVDRARLFLVDAAGLLHDHRSDLLDFQTPFAQPWEAVAGWADPNGPTSLETTAGEVAPHVLIGVSGQPGLFGEAMIRKLADDVEHPIVLPLSNPTSRAEATAEQLLSWTDGRALIATGSPSDPVTHRGVRHTISQANNVYVFPGLGLGALISEATTITDAMLRAAAKAVADVAPQGRSDTTTGILPALDQVIPASRRIALAVARAARADGVGAEIDDEALETRIDTRWWTPDYPDVTPGRQAGQSNRSGPRRR
jgi:malate dehydrogenase (oxaloacetate-decarboxylating)